MEKMGRHKMNEKKTIQNVCNKVFFFSALNRNWNWGKGRGAAIINKCSIATAVKAATAAAAAAARHGIAFRTIKIN